MHTDIDTYIRIFIIGDFNIHIKIIPYIHGLELIFTDWTDTEDIYIYLYCGSPESGGIFYNRTEQNIDLTVFNLSAILETETCLSLASQPLQCKPRKLQRR